MAQYLSFQVNYIIIYYMLDCCCILFVFVLYNVCFTCVCVVVLCIGFVLSLYVFVLYCMSLYVCVLYCLTPPWKNGLSEWWSLKLSINQSINQSIRICLLFVQFCCHYSKLKFPIMLTSCLMLLVTYHAQTYAGIIGWSLAI